METTMIYAEPPPPLVFASEHSVQEVPRVTVEVMAESLCIDCQRFFQKSLVSTYRDLGPSVVDLKVIPFGNSKIDYNSKTVTCQHGEAECDANVWEQCAVDQNPPPIYMEFLECLEGGVLPMGHREETSDQSVFEKCAAGTESLDFEKLKACHDDKDAAWSMQMKYAKKTPSNHKFVPWVLVDHQFLDVESEDLLEKICKNYTSRGGSHPSCASWKAEINNSLHSYHGIRGHLELN